MEPRQEVRVLWWGLIVWGCGGRDAVVPPTEEAPQVEATQARSLDSANEAALAIAERVAKEVDCVESGARYLCAAKRLPGVAFDPPPELETWIGLSVAVRASRAMIDGAMETASLAQLTFYEGGVHVAGLRPSNSRESLALGTILHNASLAAKGATDVIEVPESMADLLAIPPRATDALVKDDHGWGFENAQPSRLYKVPADGELPEAYVVVEEGAGGAFLSIFPLVAWAAP